MKKNVLNAILLILLVAGVFVCMFFADRIQRANGEVDIEEGYLSGASWDGSHASDVYYKLYKPKGVSESNKAPAVLLLHGYQNDRETCAYYSIELARRGYVVMSVDEYGHGFTKIGLLNRGYVDQRVTVNYGTDSAEAGTFKTGVGGPIRYRILMNFSNLSFFDEKYTNDAAGHYLTDSSCGGVMAYAALASFPYVDASNLGVSGHSMGTWSSWTVAAAFSGTPIAPKAVVLQCGELFTKDAYDEEKYRFNNVLLLQAKWDEFNYFRDYQNIVSDALLKSPIRQEFLHGLNYATYTGDTAWNTTYGSFADGSARRIELLYTNHRLTTHHPGGLATAIDWFDSALSHKSQLSAGDQVAMTKEVLVLIAMFLAIASMIPLMNLLLQLPFLKQAAVPLPPAKTVKTNGQWWKGAVVTMLIAAFTYPFMTQLGQGLLPLPETTVFRMTIGNGFVSWYLLLIIIMVVMTVVGRSKGKKKGAVQTYHEMGLGTADAPDRFGWGLFFRNLCLALLMVGFMYLLVFVSEKLFGLDFRFIWPFFKSFTGERFLQFLVYFPIFAVFFILNNSKIMASARCKGTYEKGFKGFIKAWWRVALMMAGGIVIVTLIEYIPFFLDLGPGADLLFSSTFGGPFMSLLIVFLPQILVFSILGTVIYRRTGNAFTSGLVISAMAAWIITGGSAML